MTDWISATQGWWQHRWADATAVGLAGALCWMWSRAERERTAWRRERRLREELEAYAQLDTTIRSHDGTAGQIPGEKALAMSVCRTVADKSGFERVMMLLRNAEGRLRCMGSVGVDDLTVEAMEAWAEQVMRGEPVASPDAAEPRVGGWIHSSSAKSMPISLGSWERFDREVSGWAASGRKERRRWRRAIVMPIRTGTTLPHGLGKTWGARRMVGAIVICSDGLAASLERSRGKIRVERMVSGLESLAEKLGRTLESEALSARLLRAEKLAALGQLAGGVAHALNNPLTAVLGFGELIAETSEEPRVQADARTIVMEALRMKETVQRLTEFWRPVTMSDEAVQMDVLLRDLAAECEDRLRQRGVMLELVTDSVVTPVRGSRTRLRQMMEHLLNNAAQAITVARPREVGEEHRIRISVVEDAPVLHVIVSDTGGGFDDPGRAFDPFYTTRDPVEGAGLGLSICYGIVREHGGEIAALNLYPHGAAVVVELPLGRTVTEENVVITEQQEVGRRK